jgi:hypothetical protein
MFCEKQNSRAGKYVAVGEVDSTDRYSIHDGSDGAANNGPFAP